MVEGQNVHGPTENTPKYPDRGEHKHSPPSEPVSGNKTTMPSSLEVGQSLAMHSPRSVPHLLLLPCLRPGNPNEPTVAEREAAAKSALSDKRSKTIEKARKRAVESAEGTMARQR